MADDEHPLSDESSMENASIRKMSVDKSSGREHSMPRMTRQIELTLKLLAGGLGIVTAMGLPAASFNLYQFNIPVSVISYNQILAAGAIPTLILVLMVGYCILAARILRAVGWQAFSRTLGLLFLPLMIPIAILSLFGLIAYLLLNIWAILWAIAWSVSLFHQFDISNRDLLIVAAVFFIALVVILLMLRMTYRLCPEIYKASLDFLRIIVGEWKRRPEQPSVYVLSSNKLLLLLKLSIVIPVLFLFQAYSIKGIIHLWDPNLSTFLDHERLVVFSLAGSIIYIVFMFMTSTVILSANTEKSNGKDDMGRTRKATALVVTIAAVLYLISAGVYSVYIYPRIPFVRR